MYMCVGRVRSMLIDFIMYIRPNDLIIDRLTRTLLPTHTIQRTFLCLFTSHK